MPGNFSKLVTVVTGQTITASERNNEFDNVINNMTPDGLDDASASLVAMQATTDPSGGSQATSLRGEIQRLRFMVGKMGSAAGNWYDALPWLSALTDSATPGSTATDLKNRLDQIVAQLRKLNANVNWYDAMAWLSAITPAAAGSTATDLNNRLAQIVSQIKTLGGLTNWYDAIAAAALLKSGGTMAGAIAMGANKITGLAAATANGDAARFEQLKYLQTVFASSTGTTTTSSATFVDGALTATITPSSASNRVKIIVSSVIGMGANNSRAVYGLKRGVTDLASAGFAVLQAPTANVYAPASFVYIDSPASASAVVYTTRLRNDNAVSAFENPAGSIMTMTLEEIV